MMIRMTRKRNHGNFYRVENDAQLLANRISLLKQEEMRTWKKIEETKKRADEVHRQRARNDEKLQKVRMILIHITADEENA